MDFNSNMHAHVLCVCQTNERKDSGTFVQVYLSGTLTHKGGSVAPLCANGIEYKNTVLDDACEQLGIKRLFSNPFHPNATQELRMCTTF